MTIQTTQGMLVGTERRDIYQAIEDERLQQVALGYTLDHDDALSCAEWIAILARHVGLAADDGGRIGDHARMARQAVRVAAIAVALLERLKRMGIDVAPAPEVEEKPVPGPAVKPVLMPSFRVVEDDNPIGPTAEQRGKGI